MSHPHPPTGRGVLLVALLIAGCSGDQPDLFRVELVDGVPHSVAADSPEHGNTTLELLWEAPSPDEILDGADWANPTAVAADDGTVAVLDPQLPRVHVFTPEGARAGSFGRRGGGPGEFTQPMDVAVSGDTILVRDFGRSAIQLFGRAGEYRGGFATVDGMSFAFHHLQGLGVVRSSAVLNPGGASEQRLFLIGYDDERRTVTLPGDHPLQPHVRDGDAGCWRRAGSGAHLIETDCTFPLIRILDAEGRVLRVHQIDRPPQQTPSDLLDDMAATIRESMSEIGAAPPPEFIQQMVDDMRRSNRWAPVMRLTLLTASGERMLLWEQLSADLGGGDGTLHVLDGQGRYLVRHEMGASLQAVFVTDDRIYVLVSDSETELKTLRAYGMP
jgi:hypothetical protein